MNHRRFSLKVLITACAIASIPFAVIAKARHEHARHLKLGNEIEAIGGIVSFRRQHWGPEWASDRIAVVDLGGTEVSDERLSQLELSSFSTIRVISVRNTKISDLGVETLKSSRVSDLSLGGTAITDESLDTVVALEGLTHLDLSNTAITDAGIKKLAALPWLEFLDLSETKITDASIATLREMKRLKHVDLRRAIHLSEAMYRQLGASFPNVDVAH